MGTGVAMTMKTALKRPALLGAAVLALLAGCGNAPGIVDVKDVMRTTIGGGKKAAPQQVNVAAALQATPAPLTLVVLEKTKAQSPIIEIERNGAYRTYVTPSRQTLTLRQGVVTATRGLSNDLMSSDIDATLRLLSARQPGQTRRVMRYLDGEEQIIALSFDCQMSVGGSQHVAAGEVSAQTRVMTESCAGEGLSFTNTYMVDGSGTVLSSRQWLNPTVEMAAIQVLRR